MAEYLEANPGQPAVYDAAKRRRTLIVRDQPSSSNANGAVYAIPFDPADDGAVGATGQTLMIQDQPSTTSSNGNSSAVYAIPFDPSDSDAVNARFQNFCSSPGVYVQDDFYDQPAGGRECRTRPGMMLNITYGSPIAEGEGGQYAAGGVQANDAEA